ncbi:MAG: serine/threonine-protein kinase [Nannocystaceae bacterium]
MYGDADERELALGETQQIDLESSPSSPKSADDEPLELAPTSKVGRYLLLRKIGRGGMGVVYAAYHEELDRKVALKLVHADVGGSTGGQARIHREAQALAKLSHPNVVQIYEVGEHRGQVFLAMEFVDGAPLSTWQAAPERSLSALFEAYCQAAEGLRAAHEAGLVHRDFKPENVLVGNDGRIRVLDFGLARSDRHGALTSESAHARRIDDLALTAPGAMAGTPAYMSPEQFQGAAVDLRSDVFSFAVALWEAVFGARPFAGETLGELIASVTEGPRPQPPARTNVPDRLVEALQRALRRDPEARLQSLDPLIQALSIDPATDPSGARAARRHFLAIFGAMTLLGPVAGVFFLRGHLGDIERMSYFGAIVGLATVLGIGVAFRRTLLANVYHRRMLLFLAVISLVGGSQRMIATYEGLPLQSIVIHSMHVVAAASLVAAIFFARWMVVLALIAATAIVAALLFPALFPLGVMFFGPAIMVAFAYFWSRDANRR